MPKHKSLLEWSKSLGSAAATKKGQIKAIRKYIKNIEPIINQFFRKKYYYRTFGRSIEYRATRRAEILGYPPENPEYTSYSKAYKINTLIDKWNQTYIVSLLDALNKSYTTSWNGRFTTIKLDENYRAVVAWDTAVYSCMQR